MTTLAITAWYPASGQLPEDELLLADLVGGIGFQIDGESAGDRAGIAVGHAGDFNGDGVHDLIIGASTAQFNGDRAGRCYVIYGRTDGFPETLSLSELEDSAGFKIDGEEQFDYSGSSVGPAGDVNGDGIDDLVIGAPSGSHGVGRAYVIFGTTKHFPAPVKLAELDGMSGFRIVGEAQGDIFGDAVHGTGDLNNDGLDDLVIGARYVDTDAGSSSGRVYVVFGRDDGFPATLEVSDLDGTNGFVVDGEAPNDRLGSSAGRAGDVNGDGIDDLVLGAASSSPSGKLSGRAYVIFGRNDGFPQQLQLSGLNGDNGFAIGAEHPGDRLGSSVAAAGDFNGDGIADLILGADWGSVHGPYTGQAYVLFGQEENFPALVQLADLDGLSGFRLVGQAAYDWVGYSVYAAGDFNDDGFDDLIVGSREESDPDGDSITGRAYLVYGNPDGFPGDLQLETLGGNIGLKMLGEETFDFAGSAVSGIPDLNGDGVADLVIGASDADPNGVNAAGRSYVIFGIPDTLFVDGFEL